MGNSLFTTQKIYINDLFQLRRQLSNEEKTIFDRIIPSHSNFSCCDEVKQIMVDNYKLNKNTHTISELIREDTDRTLTVIVNKNDMKYLYSLYILHNPI